IQPLVPPNPHPHLILPPLDQPASRRAHAHGTIHKLYPHGIQFIDQMSEAAGIMAMGCGGGAIIFFSFFVATAFDTTPNNLGPYCFSWSLCLFSLALARLDIIDFRYQPVLFNRATGKVHVCLDEGTKLWEVGRWFGLTRYSIHTYDWNCVRGDVAELTVLGSG